jgi:hypothetical protein
MSNHPFLSVLRATALFAACLALWPNASAQTVPAPDATSPATSPANLELDLQTLLTSSEVAASNIADPVWTLQAQPGRRLVQIPLTIAPAEQPYELSTPPVLLRGGRFIAWRIADTQSDRRSFYPSDASAPDGQLDPSVPRLVRRLTIAADGSITFRLERAIPNAEIQSARQGYALKLRPDLLEQMQPKRPERQAPSPGGNPRDIAAQRRTADDKYRQDMTTYRELRDQVRDLPETFTVANQPRIWAVYEVPDALPDWSFQGPPPLPWRISGEDWQMMRDLASHPALARGDRLDATGYERVAAMQVLVQDRHPLSHRLVAMTLAQAQMVGRVQSGDALQRLLQTIIDGPDDQARRIVLEQLASTIPPTAATLSLLRGAAQYMDPSLQLAALGGLFQSNPSDPDAADQMLATVNSTLTDENGPPAGAVLEALVNSMGQRPEALTIFVPGIEFERIPSARLDQALSYIVSAAGAQPLPAAWLNHRLLGSADPAVVRRTLESLNAAGSQSQYASRVADAIFAGVLTHAASSEHPHDQPQATFAGPIPLDSPNHTLFRSLNSGDPAIRDLAWGALRNFQIADADPRQSSRTATAPQQSDADCVSLLMDAARQQPTIPPQLIPFLARHTDLPQATAAMLQLVLQNDPTASSAAARALLRSPRPLHEPLTNLSPAQRSEFASRIYEAVGQGRPLVVGLLRQDDRYAQSLRWFADELAAGKVPDPSSWASAYRSDDELLALAAAPDPDLAAGAVSALVFAAGGDAQSSAELAQRLVQQPDRSPQGLRTAWTTAKKQIYVRRLAASAGTYRMVVLVRSGPQPGAYPAAPNAPARPADSRIVLGAVELLVDGTNVKLANEIVLLTVPETALGLRIESLGQLKNFDNEELSKLAVQDVDQPLDLLPQSDGAWSGRVPLPDAREIEVRMEPMVVP